MKKIILMSFLISLSACEKSMFRTSPDVLKAQPTEAQKTNEAPEQSPSPAVTPTPAPSPIPAPSVTSTPTLAPTPEEKPVQSTEPIQTPKIDPSETAPKEPLLASSPTPTPNLVPQANQKPETPQVTPPAALVIPEQNKTPDNAKNQQTPPAKIPPMTPSLKPEPQSTLTPAEISRYNQLEVAKIYHSNGEPKFTYSEDLKKRFGESLNKTTPIREMSRKDQEKWTKIFYELRRVAMVRSNGENKLLFIDKPEAKKRSELFERQGLISTEGAHTIAVDATAVRHHFEKSPCAEFMSEVIRQAYQRAQIPLTEDFNEAKKNELSFDAGTAAVKNLAKALLKAGWSAWDASLYRPMIGSILMHEIGQTPGHTYMAATSDGLTIIDNGYPKGKDLRQSSLKTLNNTYRTGIFFLPAGFTPKKWVELKSQKI